MQLQTGDRLPTLSYIHHCLCLSPSLGRTDRKGFFWPLPVLLSIPSIKQSSIQAFKQAIYLAIYTYIATLLTTYFSSFLGSCYSVAQTTGQPCMDVLHRGIGHASEREKKYKIRTTPFSNNCTQHNIPALNARPRRLHLTLLFALRNSPVPFSISETQNKRVHSSHRITQASPRPLAGYHITV